MMTHWTRNKELEIETSMKRKVIEAGEEIEAEQEDGFLEAGQRKVKKVQDPRLPSEEDVKDHYVSGAHAIP